jgi:LAGLIDADG-like domain
MAGTWKTAPLSWAYVGGFFDGEGSIGCAEIVRPENQRLRRQFRCQVYQNSREVLDAICAFLASEGIESKVYRHDRPDRVAKGHAGSFMLTIQGVKNVYVFLDRVSPFLIVKQEKALESIEWMWSLMEDAEAGLLDGPGPAKVTYLELRKVV